MKFLTRQDIKLPERKSTSKKGDNGRVLIIGGSEDIPVKEISHCKITDIVPTLVKMLGVKPHTSVVGKNLINF